VAYNPEWDAAAAAMPTGAILMWPTDTPPSGYLLCDGTAVDRTTYAALFAVIGETFGAGDGITTFNLPDYRGRVAIGVKASDGDFDTIGETGGAKTVTSTGSVAAPTFTGDPLGTHTHGAGTYAVADHAAHTHDVTTNVTVGNHVFTQPTIAWPVGVPTMSGIALSDHAPHTHAAGAISWPAGVPTFAGSALGTHSHGAGTLLPSAHAGSAVGDHAAHTHTFVASSTNATPDLVTSNTGGTGVAPAGTTGNPNATLTHSVTQPDAHTMSGSSEAITAGTPAGTISWPAGVPTGASTGVPSATLSHTVSSQGTIAWPAGVPTASGGAVDAHAVTNNPVTSGNPSATLTHSFSGSSEAVSGGTPAGTNSAPAYTGNATSVVQPYIAINFIVKS
jgi:microcystin-dependent protein